MFHPCQAEEGDVVINKLAQVSSIKVEPHRQKEAESLQPPWVFGHQDLLKATRKAQKVKQKHLINTINYIHFLGGTVFAHLRNRKSQEDILVSTSPQPCLEDIITCRWTKELTGVLEDCELLHLLIVDGQSVILVPADVKSMDSDSIVIHLPDVCYILGKRQAKRYLCFDISAELIQSGFFAKGDLLDFSPVAFRIKATPATGHSFQWFNPEQPVTIHLFQNQRMVFSGTCRCIRQTVGLESRKMVMAPKMDRFSRFQKISNRNPRVQMKPPPLIAFEHPFLKKMIQIEVRNVSTSGFSVLEKADEGFLMPGMIIPGLSVHFAGAVSVTCTAQVLYRLKGAKGSVRCGLVILDMDITDYGKLSNIVSRVTNPLIRITDDVDMDALWEFFFNTGFIYPKKYDLIKSYRDEFEETYRKLYKNKPEFFTHATCQKDGQIYGHASMFRVYERTWMVHHMAARPMGKKRVGLPLLRHIVQYFDGLYRLPSFKMDYMMFYFRPENKFPNLFFGGFSRDLKNPRACSLDLFTYKSYPSRSPRSPLPERWSLEEFSGRDFSEMERFYKAHSGGLLSDILSPAQGVSSEESLEMLYRRLGFIRRWKFYSLKDNEQLKAVLIVNQSDLGLNLSELLNGVKILILDTAGLPWDILNSALSQLTGVFKIDKIPLLVYPATYLDFHGVSWEKNYLLWIMDAQYGKEYVEYMQNKMKLKFQFLVKYLINKLIKK